MHAFSYKGECMHESCGILFWKDKDYNPFILFLLLIFILTIPIGIIYWLVLRKPKCLRCGSKNWHMGSQSEIDKAKEKGEVVGYIP